MLMIERIPDPDMGLLDGFDPKTRYQMIPAGGSRGEFKITTDKEPVEVSIEPKGSARLSDRVFTPPTFTPVDDHFMQLGPQTTARFRLAAGNTAGPATLVVRDRSGKMLDSLLLSAKTPLRKTYSLCILQDMRHRSPWLQPSEPSQPPPSPESSRIRPLMTLVEKVFLRQANVILTEATPQIFDVNINDIDLGNTILIDKEPDGDTRTRKSIIIQRTPDQAFVGNIVIYFTWDLSSIDGDVAGITFGNKTCFVEFTIAGTNPAVNGLVIAHELGHALGLQHNGGGNLMAPGLDIVRSSRLEQFEIDTINPSGIV